MNNLLPLHAESSVTVCRWYSWECKRKVRAAEDAPLVKVPAVGDGRIREKKTTAKGLGFVKGALSLSKGEKVV